MYWIAFVLFSQIFMGSWSGYLVPGGDTVYGQVDTFEGGSGVPPGFEGGSGVPPGFEGGSGVPPGFEGGSGVPPGQ